MESKLSQGNSPCQGIYKMAYTLQRPIEKQRICYNSTIETTYPLKKGVPDED